MSPDNASLPAGMPATVCAIGAALIQVLKRWQARRPDLFKKTHIVISKAFTQ